jgi:hypothetical protein
MPLGEFQKNLSLGEGLPRTLKSALHGANGRRTISALMPCYRASRRRFLRLRRINAA